MEWLMSRFSFANLLFCIVILTASPGNATSPAVNAENFVKNVSKNAIEIIQEKLTSEQKEAKLTELFLESVNTAWMARFAMGKYWNGTTKEQKNKYIEAHKKFLLGNYIPKFKEYNNQQVKVLKTLDSGDAEYTVVTKLVAGDGVEINIDYKIKKNEAGKNMIFDVVAEGVSLITTQRADFSAILSREGVDGLISKLEAK
jgi:phospholipid transport system substrate-binding protein